VKRLNGSDGTFKITSVIGVPSQNIDDIWEEVAPLIENAMEYSDGKMAVEDVYMAIKSNEYQLWLVPGGAWVTRIVSYPQSTRLEGIAAGGEWQDWLTHGQQVIDWARLNGCDAVELIGRPGWGRKTGFEEIHRTFRMRI
jgi:hypothetical protein